MPEACFSVTLLGFSVADVVVLGFCYAAATRESLQRFGVSADRSQESLYGLQTPVEDVGRQRTQPDAGIAVFDWRNAVAVQFH